MESSKSPAPKRILVVEDDEPTVFLYKLHWSRTGFTVVSAEDLKSGIEKLFSEEFDAVIFDLRLPDGNSLDVIPDVRAKNTAIKIFVVSGLSDPAVASAALAAGVDEFLVKPFEIDELCARIARAIT